MRRKDKAVSDESDIRAIIEKATVCRLAMVEGNKPYVVPLCFGFHDNVLYFHGAQKSKKIDLLRENPHVCFEFDLIAEPMESEKACDWSMKYQSVIGFGKAIFIENSEEKRNALGIIMAHYSDRLFQFPDDMITATSVIKVEIESMTGKHSGFR